MSDSTDTGGLGKQVSWAPNQRFNNPLKLLHLLLYFAVPVWSYPFHNATAPAASIGNRNRTVTIRSLVLLGLTASLFGCGQPVPDSRSTPQPGETNSESDAPDWTPEFAEMQSALAMSDEESAKVQAAFEKREVEVSAWMATHGAKLAKLEKTMRTAARSRDLAGVRNTTSKAKPLRDALRELIATHTKTIPAALSKDNQSAWAAYQLSQEVLDLMEDLNLTPEQIEQIQVESHSVMQSAVDKTEPQPASVLALQQFAETKVLTKDQIADYESVKKKNPLRLLR